MQPVPFLLATVSTSAITIGVTAVHRWYNSNERLFAIAACKAKVSPAMMKQGALPYVARAQIDAELVALVDCPRKTIVIVIGPRGAGKTTAVTHALQHIDGALMTKLTGVHSHDSSIYTAIMKKVIGRPLRSGEMVDEEELVSYLKATTRRYKKHHPHAVDWKPTIILEIETSAQPATVRVAVQTMKGLVWDRGVCHGFLVLSDAHSVYSLTSDRGRHTYTWVGDFSSAEADVYLDELDALTTAEEREFRADVYRNATTRAIELSELAALLKAAPAGQAHKVVRAFVLEMQSQAWTRVNNLIGVAEKAAKLGQGEKGLHLIRLMKAMLKEGGSLPVTSTRAYLCPDSDIADVLKRLGHHAIAINAVTRTFVFNTPADHVVAEQLLGQYDSHEDGFGPMP
jgi:hypothetical protein